jgi:CysZ protein
MHPPAAAARSDRALGNPVLGGAYVLRGLALITRPGLRRYVALPLVLNTLVLAALVVWSSRSFEHLLDWTLSRVAPGLDGVLRALAWLVFAALAGWLVFHVFVITVTILGSPFYALMAQKLEAQLTGCREQAPFRLRALAQEMCYTLGQEARKAVYFALLVVPCLLLFLVPGINVLAPFALVLYSAWTLGLECIDFPLSAHRIPFRRQRRLARRKLLRTLGFGGTAVLLTLIPGLNLVAIPAAVAGATALWVDRVRAEAQGAGV